MTNNYCQKHKALKRSTCKIFLKKNKTKGKRWLTTDIQPRPQRIFSR